MPPPSDRWDASRDVARRISNSTSRIEYELAASRAQGALAELRILQRLTDVLADEIAKLAPPTAPGT